MSHTILTHHRSVLMLEGLWDQLESVATAMRNSNDQPGIVSVVRSRVTTYRLRLREIMARIQQTEVRGAEAATQQSLAAAMTEVAELLDGMQHEPPSGWTVIIYRAQDAVLAALHELRYLARTDDALAARMA